MARRYLPVDRDQAFLLPPDLREWLPADHLAWFVLDVVGELDLGEFHARRRLGGAGRAGYDPAMLLAVLIYAYALGERSSRQIERLCVTDVAFRVICAQHRPDHATIARFRAEHEAALAGLFGQVLEVCAAAGMGRFGTVALDGTKIAANAALSANRREGWVRERAARILAEAGEVDAAEDALFGAVRGDELPREFANPATRAQRIRAALAELDTADDQPAEGPGGSGPPVPPTGTAGQRRHRQFQRRLERARARVARLRAAHEAKHAADAARRVNATAQGRVIRGGSRPKPVDQNVKIREAGARLAKLEREARGRAGPHPLTPNQVDPTSRKVNLTDPQSRTMMTRAGWVQGYNAQLVVSEDHLILAADLTNSPVDVLHYQPLVAAAVDAVAHIGEHTGRPGAAIGCVLADAGYASEANLTADGPDRLIALSKRHTVEDAAAHPVPHPGDHATARDRMRHRLASPDGLNQYRRRASIVEPIHGHLKDRRGLRRFSRRGQAAATSELTFAAAVTNLLRLRAHATA
jgi:transposase